MRWRKVLSWVTEEERPPLSVNLTPQERAVLEIPDEQLGRGRNLNRAELLSKALNKLEAAGDESVQNYPIHWTGVDWATSYVMARTPRQAEFLARQGFDDGFEANGDVEWEFSEVGEL